MSQFSLVSIHSISPARDHVHLTDAEFAAAVALKHLYIGWHIVSHNALYLIRDLFTEAAIKSNYFHR
jgi:hypothetical protein